VNVKDEGNPALYPVFLAKFSDHEQLLWGVTVQVRFDGVQDKTMGKLVGEDPLAWVLCADGGLGIKCTPLKLPPETSSSLEISVAIEDVPLPSPTTCKDFNTVVELKLFTVQPQKRTSSSDGSAGSGRLVDVPLSSSTLSLFPTIEAVLRHLDSEFKELCHAQFQDSVTTHTTAWSVRDCGLAMQQELAQVLCQCLPWESQPEVVRQPVVKTKNCAAPKISAWLQPIKREFIKDEGNSTDSLTTGLLAEQGVVQMSLDSLLRGGEREDCGGIPPTYVTAELSGQLGDQLFQVFNTLAYARRFDLRIAFSREPTYEGIQPRGF